MLEQLKPNSKTIVSDLIAGLTVSLVNLAELMGYALVAGVDPIYGLYSGIVAPIVAARPAVVLVYRREGGSGWYRMRPAFREALELEALV